MKIAFIGIGNVGFAIANNLQMSLHLEHLTLLWVKMVRLGGHMPHFVWSRLVK